MTIDDETVRRILDATFGAVEADVAVEAERGPLVHVAPDGRRIYQKQDGDTSVITMTGAGRATSGTRSSAWTSRISRDDPSSENYYCVSHLRCSQPGSQRRTA